MNIKIVLATIIVLTLLVACGPAAPAGQDGGESQSQTPTPTNQDDGPVDVPTPKPTETPKRPPDVDPTSTPKPEPTRDPGDPASEPKKATVVVPPPDNGEAGVDLRVFPEPPNGIEGCYSINIYASTIQELEYTGWCVDALLQDVSANCAGIGTSADELRCGQERLADVETYFLREVGTPCAAISDPTDRQECSDETLRASDTHMTTLWSTWGAIQNTVDSNARVRVAHVAMADCVEKKGLRDPRQGHLLRGSKANPLMVRKLDEGSCPLPNMRPSTSAQRMLVSIRSRKRCGCPK